MMAAELNVSLRTAARDFDYLMHSLHVPLTYDYRKKSYVLTGEIPPILIEPSEPDGER
jgi:predicted DNA-binding transcriptional regulator YafY